MTTLNSLRELEKRLVEAKGADRELDLAIADSIPEVRGRDVLRDSEGRRVTTFSPLPVTASLDAAVSLTERVLPGWFWRVGHSTLYAGWAHLNRTHPDNCDRKDEASADAATPALALCLACVRALIAQGEK